MSESQKFTAVPSGTVSHARLAASPAVAAAFADQNKYCTVCAVAVLININMDLSAFAG